MAQSVYDPESEEKSIPHSLNDITGVTPDEEEAGETTGSAADDLAKREGLFNPDGDNPSRSAASGTDDLQAAESGAGSGSRGRGDRATTNDSDSAGGSGDGGNSHIEQVPYNPEGDKRTGIRGKLQGATDRIDNLKARASKHKLLVGGALGGGATLIIVLFLLLLIAGSLKIPNLASNILGYEFTRITRESAESADRVSNFKLAMDSLKGLKNRVYEKISAKYQGVSSNVTESQTWTKLNEYRPNKVIEKLATDKSLKLKYEGDRFVGATINGEEFKVKDVGKYKYVPGLNKVMNFKSSVEFSRQYIPALEKSLADTSSGPIIRGIVANRLRRQMGISLIAWQTAKYKNANEEKARLQEEKDKIKKIDGENPKVNAGVTDKLNEAEDAAAKAAAEAESTDAGVQEIINKGGVISGVKEAVGNSLKDSPFETVINFADPLAALTPFCIVYDGSVDESGPTVDQSSRQATAAFYYIASASDQQKNGTQATDDGDGLAVAVAATNDDLGNIENSDAQVWASGGTPNTLGSISPEASAAGQFTLFNALPGMPSTAASILNHVAPACKKLTNLKVQIGIGILNFLGQLIPGEDLALDGGEAGLEAAGKTLTTHVIQEPADSLAVRLLTKVGLGKAAKVTTKTGSLLYDTGKNAAQIAGITILAKLIVLMRAAQIQGGTSQGNDLSNEATAGANVHANELTRIQYFGRPLTEDEVCKSNADDRDFVAYQRSQQSVFQRYLSTSNPTSLVSQTAVDISANLHGNIFNRFFQLATWFLRPSTIANYFSHIFFSRTLAAGNCANDATDYGIVQFGYSDAEQKLKAGDSYQILPNQDVLNESGKEAEIAQKYSICFGYDYTPPADNQSPNLDPNDDGSNLTLADGEEGDASMGTLLANGDILRDEHGNVLDDASKLCSPTNLGPHNPKYGDLVFRWRIAEEYMMTLDQYNSVTSPTNDSGATVST